jgi:hypothetical protein
MESSGASNVVHKQHFPYLHIGPAVAGFFAKILILLPYIRSFCEFKMAVYAAPAGYMALWSATHIVRAAIGSLGVLSSLGMITGRHMDQFSRSVVAVIVMSVAFSMLLSANVMKGHLPSYRLWRQGIITVWSLVFNSAFFLLRIVGWAAYGIAPNEYIILNVLEMLANAMGLMYRAKNVDKFWFYEAQLPFAFLLLSHAYYLGLPTAIACATWDRAGKTSKAFLGLTILAGPVLLGWYREGKN